MKLCLAALSLAAAQYNECSPPEASEYELVSTVSIPKNNANWDRASQIPYKVNNAVSGGILRAAYCMKLGDKWVWTSFDSSDSSKLGVPADYKLDGNVNNMNVYSNVVKTQVGITGKAEFWDNCYASSGGNSRAYDHDDTPTSANCYGSMQIHSGKNTVFGFNGWSHSGHCGVTIGNNKGTHTDGTFLTNCNSYQDGVSEIRTYIKKDPNYVEPVSPCSTSPEASNYELVSTVSIPKNNANWDRASQIPYKVNNAVSGPIQRAAYCMQLGDKWVWTSFDYSDSSKLGVPADYKLDGNVNNMNVYSNAVKTQVGITGKAEFWDNCYAPSGGNSRAFDHDDRPTSANCYGSMQIHSGKNTVFGFNGWSHSGHCGVTIGNNKGTHTDGTFLTNCNSYQDGVSEIRTYIEKPKPINCAGAFGGFSTCTKTCGGGSKIRTYKITEAAKHGGAACSHADGHVDTAECNTDECTEEVDIEMEIDETEESFTEDKKEAFRDQIAKQLGLKPEDIEINVGQKPNPVARRRLIAAGKLLITVTIKVKPSQATEEVAKLESPTFAKAIAKATGIKATFKAFKPAHGSSICATCKWDGHHIEVTHYLNAQKHGESGLQHKCYHDGSKCKCVCNGN